MLIHLVLLLILPELLVSFIISLGSYLKHRYLSLLYDSFTSLFMEIGLVSELLSYYINMRVLVLGRTLNLNVFLRTTFIILGFVFWTLSINYLTSNQMPKLLNLVAFIGGGIIVSSLFETDLFSSLILVTLEIAGLVIVSFILIRHLVYSMRQLKTRKSMKHSWVYLLGISIFVSGFILLIINGLLIYRYSPLIDLLDLIATIILFTGYSIIMLTSALYPEILLTTYVMPYTLYLVTTSGETFFQYSFTTSIERLDPELVGSAMTGISMMTSEIIGKDLPMKLIEHEAFYIILAHGEKILGFLFTNQLSKILSESLQKLIKVIETKHIRYIDDILILDDNATTKIKNETEKIFYYLI